MPASPFDAASVFGMRVAVLPPRVIAAIIAKLRKTRPDAFEVGSETKDANMVVDEARGIIYVTEEGRRSLVEALPLLP